jgi:hypothetical protein
MESGWRTTSPFRPPGQVRLGRHSLTSAVSEGSSTPDFLRLPAAVRGLPLRLGQQFQSGQGQLLHQRAGGAPGDLDATKGLRLRPDYHGLVSSQRVPGGVVHPLPADLREALMANHSTRCLEGHHTLGAQRVHLLGRGCQAAENPRTPHSPDSGRARGRPAPPLLLAGVHAPRPRQPAPARLLLAVAWGGAGF